MKEQWRNEAPGAPATPEGAVIGGRRIVLKMWDKRNKSLEKQKFKFWFIESTNIIDKYNASWRPVARASF